MSKNRIAKIAALSVGLTLAFGASTAGAQTIADLQAQINALLAQLAALQGGSTTPATPSVTFTQNLTLGSTGSEVSALQQMLVAQGHLVMPAGVAYGYFGPLTQSAVAKWQAANGVSPAAGYWGPISRARYAAMAPTTPGTTTPTTPGAGITTPGVEGTLTATLNPTPISGVKVYEGDTRRAVLGIKLEAKTSDIRVERVRLQIPSTSFYNRVASRVYIMDGSTVIGSADLNSNTVVREGPDYFVTISGMTYVVPRDATRVLDVALDFNSSIDSTNRAPTHTAGNTITIPVNGVRGTDGAGINQFSPTSVALSRTMSIESEFALDAALKVSLNTNSPVAREVVAAAGSDNDELDGLELVRFDVRAEKDSVMINDLTVTITNNNDTAGATTTTAYLYDGGTLIGSETANVGASGTVVFDNIDYTIPRDTTRTLMVKVDVRNAVVGSTVLAASVGSGTTIVAQNSKGDLLATGAKTGSATGVNQTVRKIGLEFALVSKSITKGSTPVNNNISTSTAEAVFTVRATAVGGDILLGENGSSTPFVTNAGNDGTSDNPSFVIYRGGSAVTGNLSASTTGFTIPTTNTVAAGTLTRTLQEGNSVDIPVSFLFHGRDATSAFITTGSYAVGLEKLNWVSSGGLQHSTFMSGVLDWRTATVTMP